MGRGWLKIMGELQGTGQTSHHPLCCKERQRKVFFYELTEIRKKKTTSGVRKIMGTSASQMRCGAGRENISACV